MILLPAVEGLSREDLEEWSREGRTGLVLHSVGNDHNLGAIARSAAFFDVKYIVIAEDDPVFSAEAQPDAASEKYDSPSSGSLPEARLSTSTYRVAEGGMEHVTVRTVRNTAAFLREASRHLITIGADTRARQRIGDLSRIIAGETGRSGIAVVLGNEETGLPNEVKDACSVMVRIPGTGLMDSLNVAQAATLFMQKIFEH